MLGIGIGAMNDLAAERRHLLCRFVGAVHVHRRSQAGFVPIAAWSFVILPTPPIGSPSTVHIVYGLSGAAWLEPLRLPTRELRVITLSRAGSDVINRTKTN